MSDIDQIVSGCRAGEPQAFAALFRRFEQRVYDLACVILRDPIEAQDAVQETFVRVWERIDSFAGTAAFETWLISIAVNHCRDRLRRRKVRQVLSLSGLRLSSSRRDPAAMLEEKLFQDALWQMVNQLEDRLRLPFILRYRYEYSCGEVADILGLAVNTIYEQLSRARRQLRQMAEESMQSENQSNLLFKKL